MAKAIRRKISAFAGWMIVLSFASAVAGAERLPAPAAEAARAPSTRSGLVPKWENGLLLARDDEIVPAMVSAFDRTGRLVTEARISLPETARIILAGVAASPAGVIAVTGDAISDNGAVAFFIAWISPSGAVTRVVRTSPFRARQLSFGQDETLWALGTEKTADLREASPHNVLRYYDRDGRLVQSLLPRESFAGYDSHHPSYRAFLTASAGRVGLYTVTAQEWIEVSLSGEFLGRWKGLEVGSAMITGVGLTPSGSVYISSSPESGPVSSRKTEFYRLDKDTGAWAQVDGSNVVGGVRPYAHIAGTDGASLVALSGANLLWIPAE